MVQQGLIEYIQRLLRQGYDKGTIRTTLLNAGYAPADIDVAMRAASGEVHRKIPTKLLVVIFVALLVLSGAVLLVLKVMQPPRAEVTFSMSLFSTVVEPGGEVVLTVRVVNPSGSRVEGLIDFTVSGPGGRLESRTESFEVRDQTNLPLTFGVPEGAVEGQYTIEASLSYVGGTVRQSETFEVAERVEVAAPSEALEEAAEEEAREAQLTCPTGCDDLNFCTDDACVDGECVHTPIVPCCGNRKCEAGESESLCPVDCGERREGPEEVKAQAVELASSDVAGAIGVCDGLAQREFIDACLRDVSQAANVKEPCAMIVDADTRDGCYIPFAYTGDYAVCDEITNKYMKNSCLSLQRLQGMG